MVKLDTFVAEFSLTAPVLSLLSSVNSQMHCVLENAVSFICFFKTFFVVFLKEGVLNLLCSPLF